MVRSITQNTTAGQHFLSVLQHMLLIRDDYYARSVTLLGTTCRCFIVLSLQTSVLQANRQVCVTDSPP